MLADQTCPICGKERVRVEPVLGHPYRECGTCGFLWRVDRENFPNPNEAYQVTDQAAQNLLVQERDSARGPYYAAQVRRVHRFIRPPGQLLELGCGTGGLAKAFQDAEWEVTAVDSSPALCSHARNLLGAQNVVEASVECAELKAAAYDAVVALDLLEHLPDTRVLPEKAFQTLRPGGFFFLQTPNGKALRRFLQRNNWNQIKPEMHYLIHSPESLRRLLRECGFRLENQTTVSGTATAGLSARLAASIYGALLALLGMGNALYCVAQKPAQ